METGGRGGDHRSSGKLLPPAVREQDPGVEVMTPNRIAVYLTALAALAGGLAPAIADLDWTSTAGVIAGLVAILSVVQKWLSGWQQHEARQATAATLRAQQTPYQDSSYINTSTGSEGQVNRPTDPSNPYRR